MGARYSGSAALRRADVAIVAPTKITSQLDQRVVSENSCVVVFVLSGNSRVFNLNTCIQLKCKVFDLNAYARKRAVSSGAPERACCHCRCAPRPGPSPLSTPVYDIYIYVYVYIYTYIYVYTYICINVIYIHIHNIVCICILIYLYIFI